MYLSRELTDASLPKIGKEFGGRDHTTVLHANAKITRMISEDRLCTTPLQDLTARINIVDDHDSLRQRHPHRLGSGGQLAGRDPGQSRMDARFPSVFPAVHTPYALRRKV